MKKWFNVSRDATPIETELDHIDCGENVYRVWVAGRPEPEGNPVKWHESTLRESGYAPEDEGHHGSSG